MTLGIPALFALYIDTGSRDVRFGIYFCVFLLLAYACLNYLLRSAVPRSHLLFLLYFFALGFSTVLSFATGEGQGSVLQLKALGATFILMSAFISATYVLRTRADVSFALRGIDVAGLLISFSVYLSAVLYQFDIRFGEVHSHSGGEIRSFGPLGDQVAFVLLLFLVRSLANRQWLIFAFQLGALLLTATRGAVIVFAVALILLRIFRELKSGRKRGQALAALVAIGLVTAALVLELGGFLMDRFINPDALAHGISSRLGSMMLGLMVFADSPIFGIGFNGFQEAVWAYGPESHFDVFLENYISTTSNQMVQTAVDGGVMGLTALVVALAGILLHMYRRIRTITEPRFAVELKSLWVWALALVIGNQSAVWILPDSFLGYMFFLVTGIGCSAPRPVARVDLPFSPAARVV